MSSINNSKVSVEKITESVSNIQLVGDPRDEEIVNKIVKDIFVNKRNVLLSGSGGTGKSFLIVNVIKKIAESKSISIAITSTTGVAALSINGTTIHRWAGIKLGKEPLLTIVNRIKQGNKDCYNRWKEAKILVIDEISMLGLQTFELIDKVGRYIKDDEDKPFGGMQVVFSGDFLQLPPVNDEFAFKSEIWDKLNIRCYRLTRSKRYPDEDHFQMLQRVRVGKPSPEDVKKLKKRVDAYIDYVGSGREKKEDIKPTRIFSYKKDVEKFNLDELAKIPGEPVYFNSIDKFIVKQKKDEKKEKKKEELTAKDTLDYTEYMNTIIPRQLLFKVGAQVMLTYNLSPDIGLVNGSRGVVKALDQDGVLVSFKNGITTRIVYNPNEFEDGRVKMVRHQIPLILAYAISIHKSQGSSLDCAIMDLGTSIFAPGMAYVALSRVRTLDGLLISGFISSKLYADKDALEFEELMEAMESADDETSKVDEVVVDESSDSELEINV